MRGVWYRRLRAASYRALGSWLLLAAALPASAEPATVRVAVAANFRAVLESLARDYEAVNERVRIDLISGSTGKLYAQIVAGAPFDLFLAADQARPERLLATGRAVAGTRHTYAIGRLVLWDPRRADGVGPDRLQAGDFRRLALAKPALAPYGAAAQAVLRDLGLEDSLRDRLVFGENVAQTFAFVRSGNAGLGFVALSQLRALPPSVIGSYWEPDLNDRFAIRQDMVLLQRAEGRKVPSEFYSFLRSNRARAVIESAGYRVSPNR
ncbi:MAG: molybdate ABC transporter substrate-binding protein [Pseudomonadota bacterium]